MRIHVAHLVVAVVILISSVSVAKDTPDQPVKAAVERVLQTQQEAWNHHDLEGFMGHWSRQISLSFRVRRTSGWRGPSIVIGRLIKVRGRRWGACSLASALS
jgi:hypothetical protein